MGPLLPLLVILAQPPSLSGSECTTVGCLRQEARTYDKQARDCGTRIAAWQRVLEKATDDLEAYRGINRCAEQSPLPDWVGAAFEESYVLGLVPQLLQNVGVKDALPVVNRLKAKENKTLRDLMLIAELSSDTEEAFTEQLLATPNDPKVYISFGFAKLKNGERVRARALFRDGLRHERTWFSLRTAFVAALGWPAPFLVLMLGLMWSAGLLALREGDLREIEGIVDEATGVKPKRARPFALGVAAAVCIGVSFKFVTSGHPIAFAAFLFGGAVGLLFLFVYPVRKFVRVKIFQPTTRTLANLYSGRFVQRLLFGLAPGTQFAILIGTVLLLVGATLLPPSDLRVLLVALAAASLIATIGSLILAFLRRSKSLHRSLAWLALGGSFPFLAILLGYEWDGLVGPLTKGLAPSGAAMTNALIYIGLWALGALGASLVGRIVARSIVDPLDKIGRAIKAVRLGEFDVKTEVERGDEIGNLADAVDEMAIGLKMKESIQRKFRRYVDPRVADWLIEGGTQVTRGRRMHATVMFIDVRGFTSMSEKLPPETVVELLNAHFGEIDPIIRKWGGVVDKFVGDGLLAVWDVPHVNVRGELADVRGERLAVMAATAVLDAVAKLNAQHAEKEIPEIEVGIGINAGVVISGGIGSREREDYTVVGNTVNTAQRVESKAGGDAPILVTHEVAEVVEDLVILEQRETVPLKGKSEAVVIYKVVALKSPLPEVG